MTNPEQTQEKATRHCPFCSAALPIESSERYGETACPQCGKRLWFCQQPEGLGCVHGAEQVAALRARVVPLIVKNLNADPEKVTDGSSFMEDFGADSLDVVELVMGLEEEFKITIPDTDAEKIKTVGDLLDYLVHHPAQKQPAERA
jgi:acyl carrier protein